MHGISVTCIYIRQLTEDRLNTKSFDSTIYKRIPVKGYQAQIAETYTKVEGNDALRIIVQPAHESDAKPLSPISRMSKKGR